MYDDAWLRTLLEGLRDDLRGHMHDDRVAIDGIKGELQGLRNEVREVRETIQHAHRIGFAAAKVARWALALTVGGGGLWSLAHTVTDWIKH